jgi:hypothetical protein
LYLSAPILVRRETWRFVKNLLTASAVIELGAGVALLCCPAATVALLVGTSDSSSAEIVARIGGGALLALGVACFLARDDGRGQAGRGLVAAMAVYDLVAASVLAYAGAGLGMRGVGLWPAAALHAAMAVWCAASIRRQN